MLVKLGPPVDWFGPYQLADLLQHVGVSEDTTYKIGNYLSETPLYKAMEWLHSLKKAKKVIKLHNYDTWNMDNTLALIVAPMLKQLQATKHGAPFTDDEDVPERLKSYNAPDKEQTYDVDDLHHPRWDYILGEMIYAFETYTTDWDSKYHSKGDNPRFVPAAHDPNYTVLEYDKDDEPVFDKEGHIKEHDRIANGFRLFGKYYTHLWD